MERKQEREKRLLVVSYTDEEKAALGVKLAGLLSDIENQQQDMKTFLAERKAHLESLIAQKMGLVQALNRGNEWRIVECVKEINEEEGTVKIFRTDTMQMVEKRFFTEEEKQQDLTLTFELKESDGQEIAMDGGHTKDNGPGGDGE